MTWHVRLDQVIIVQVRAKHILHDLDYKLVGWGPMLPGYDVH